MDELHDLKRRMANHAIWVVVWTHPPAVFDERRSSRPNRAVVWGGGGPTGGRLIQGGLTLAEAEALAALINEGEQHGS